MPEIRPLQPAADDYKETTAVWAKIHRDRFIKCCGCIAALLLVQTVVAVTLAFTVFKFKSPIIRVEKPTFDKFELINGGNMTLNADILVKNPNLAFSFRFGNMTTTLFYRGTVIGELRGPPGRAKARQTVRVNITVDIMKNRILSRHGFKADIYSGLVNVSSYTRVGGRMKLFMFEKQMRMKMKCNVSVNVTTKAIQQHRCKRKIKF